MTDISKFVGIPYKHNGRSFNGIDCLGVVVKYLETVGINIPDNDGKEIEKYWYKQDPERLVKILNEKLHKIEYNDIRGKDIVLFQFNKIPCHLGVMVNFSYLLHAREGHSVSMIRLKRMKRFFHSAYRIGGEFYG